MGKRVAPAAFESEGRKARRKRANDTVNGADASATGAAGRATAPASGKPPSTGVVRPQLLSPESQEALRQAYATSQPYLHCVFNEPFDPQLLVRVREEIINHIQATYKETDLFKVFQTGDLGNLSKLDPAAAAKLPALMALKDALYSQPFRSFIQEVTGCGELSDKTDCSCNVYADGGHLLCHDDVIGTRRVSYIIYLTDPDDPWTEEDGGALELYPCVEGQPHTPAVFPTVCHLPTFNTMAMFTVQPGKSFHAIQEVMAPAKPRMSISGWYHGSEAPQAAGQASLQQLQTLKAGADLAASDQYAPFSEAASSTGHEDTGEGLSEADLALLVKYVNPAYLSESGWPKMQAKFAEDGSMQLHNFLKRSVADSIFKKLVAEDRQDGIGAGAQPQYEAGVRDGWEPVGPPHKQRYLRYSGTSAVAGGCGAQLAEIRDELFASGAFARLLRCFTTLTMVGHRGEVRRFRAGLDYTVAHYGILTKDPRLDVVLCFVDASDSQGPSGAAAPGISAQAAKGGGKNAMANSTGVSATGGKRKSKRARARQKRLAAARGQGKAVGHTVAEQEEGGSGGAGPRQQGSSAAQLDKAAAWEAGEVGGFEAYLLADDEDGEAADTYRAKDADESGVLNVSAAFNSLSLVLRDEGLMRFIKFVSRAAPSSRWDIALECLPEDDSDDEGEGQDT